MAYILTKRQNAPASITAPMLASGVLSRVDTVAALRALRPTTDTQLSTRGYYAAGDGGGATYQWVVGSPLEDNAGSVIADASAEPGAWLLVPGNKLFARQFGGRGTGLVNDRDQVQAMIDYGAALNINAGVRSKEVCLGDNFRCRLDSSLYVRPYLRFNGHGGVLLGNIGGAGYVAEGSSPTVPAGSDWLGQTAGAAFTDDPESVELVADDADVKDQIQIYGCQFENFRWGILSRCFAWTHPVFDDNRFQAVNCAYFAYRGAQYWSITRTGGNPNTLFVGMATCFTSDSPFAGKSAFFCEGLSVDGMSVRPHLVENESFDSWFSASILRPTTPSKTVGKTVNAYPFPANLQGVTGRAVNLMGRQLSVAFITTIRNLSILGAKRGLAFVVRPRMLLVENCGGEGVLDTPTKLNSFITVSCGDGTFRNITVDEYSAVKPKGAIEVIDLGDNTPTSFFAYDVLGEIVGSEYFTIASNYSSRGTVKTTGFVQKSTEFTASGTQAGFYAGGGTFYKSLNGDNFRLRDGVTGQSVATAFAATVLPNVNGDETKVIFNNEGVGGERGSSQYMNGVLEVFLRRQDTGDVDYGRYRVQLPTTSGFTDHQTLQPASINSNKVDVKYATAYAPGMQIQLGDEKYLVRSVSGDTLTLATGLRVAVATGTAVLRPAQLTSLEALSQPGWGTLSLVMQESNRPRLQVSSALGLSIPLEVSVSITYPGAPV